MLGMAGRQGEAIVTSPDKAATLPATERPRLRHHRFLEAVCGRIGSSAFSPARIFSGVKGNSRKRMPVASYTAFAIAAALGTDADSPTPSGGSSCLGIISTSISGTSGNVISG